MPAFTNRFLKVAAQDLKTAEQVVDRSGLPEWCEKRYRTQLGDYKGGAHTQLSWRHLFLGLVLVAMSEQPMILRDVVRTLNALSRKQKKRLGLPESVTERMVSIRYNHFADLIDPSPYSLRNRARREELSDVEWQQQRAWRQAGLETVLDRILAASIPDDARDDGNYAVDSSGVPSWSRQNQKWSNPDTATDPDASWRAHMSTTKPYAQSEGNKPHFGGKAWYGYNLNAFVRIPSLTANKDGSFSLSDTPAYVERISLTTAGSNEAKDAAELLARINHREPREYPAPVGDIVMDRAYSLGFENFLKTVRALGYKPHFDLRADQRGLGGSVEGMVIVDGQPYSPSMPKSLYDVKTPKLPGASRDELEAWFAQNDRRRAYQIRVRGINAETMAMDLSCPAARDFGALRCNMKPESVLLPATIPSAPPVSNPDFPPKICSQQRVRVDGDALPLWQPYQYGTRGWWKSLSRRARVEGAFGRLKNDATHNITRGRFRVMGLAKTSIMTAFLVAAANLATTARLAQAQADAAAQQELSGVDRVLSLLPSTKRGPRARTTRLAAHRALVGAGGRARERLGSGESDPF